MSQGKVSRSIFGRITSSHDREEQGYPPAQNTTQNQDGSFSGSGTVRPLTVATTDVAALIPHGDKLLVFRAITGIDTVPALTTTGHSQRPAPNIGIYSRVVKAEKSSASSYRIFNLVINMCLGIQVLVAAVLTALGAANGPHKAVTAFGAINTIIAGILTYLKGSGLPDRLKHQENEWKRVREYIEQREREFCLLDSPLDVNEEIAHVEDMYKKVKLQLEGAKSPTTRSASSGERPKSIHAPLNAAKPQVKRPESSSTMPLSEKPSEKPAGQS